MRNSLAVVAVAMILAIVMVEVEVEVEASPNTGWVWQVCSPDRIPPGSPYFDTVGTALADIVQNTARTDFGSGYFYRITKTSSTFPINNNNNNAAGVAYGGYGPGSGYAGNNNNDAGAGGPTSNLATVYAAARCSDHLPPQDCRDCLRVITDGIWSACSNAVSAQLKLVDCFVRYDHYNFDD